MDIEKVREQTCTDSGKISQESKEFISRGRNMANKIFTQEDVAAFKANPYVKSVTARKITFTVSFKEEFWARYTNGELAREILRSMGFDTDALGEIRIRGIVSHTKEQADSGAGFTEGYNWHDKNKPVNPDLPVAKRLLRVEHELAYAKQELEFIKKTILADKEARRKCSSKQDRMSSSNSSGK